MASIFHHSGIGYAIHTHNGLDWVWKIYPRLGQGQPICGSIRGTEDDAVSACLEAIEFKLRVPQERRRDPLNLVRLSV